MGGTAGAELPDSVLLAGGGSAGHVSPLLALADCLTRRRPSMRVTALGTAAGLEAELVPARGYRLRTVPKVAFPRRPNRLLVRFPQSLGAAVRAAVEAIEQTRAQVVVGFGGYVSAPAYLAARRLAIPIVVHEGNARPGLANRLGAQLTHHVATTFAATRLPHARLLGMPLRTEITTLDREATRPTALAEFGLAPGRPTVLVTGGSLGAQRLNTAFAAAAGALSGAGIQVLHLTGHGKEVQLAALAGPGRYLQRPYADRMELAYAAADLVVARAGANTVCELCAVGLPGVYVPLPIGNGEQRRNAADVVAAGGGLLVDDSLVSADWVSQVVVPMATDTHRLAVMSEAAARVGRRDADELLADLVAEAYAGGGTRPAGAARVGR